MREPRPQAFRCPACHDGLEEEGEALRCRGCGRTYPVEGGIPQFASTLCPDVASVRDAFELEHGLRDLSADTRLEPALTDRFLDLVELEAAAFAGIDALDAGCGSGRWTYALASLGARVCAFDLTHAGTRSVASALADAPNVRVCQADLFAPPFAPASFDFVLSWGVLHHTASTRAGFRALAPLVRPGGTMYVMVYEREPVLVRVGTGALRLVLRRLPPRRRLAACRLLVVRDRRVLAVARKLALVGYVPHGATRGEIATAQLGLYDAYSPRWNHQHTPAEVVSWFEAEGLEDVRVLGTGGAVHVRGTRRAEPNQSSR